MPKMCSITIALQLLLGFPMLAAAAGDTDGDGIADNIEDSNSNGVVDGGETDPMNADTDRGGEADGSEILGKRDPFLKDDDFTFDQDGDGLTNGQEAAIRTDPKKADTDGDGSNDKDDPFPLDPSFKKDEDKDDIADEWEAQHHLSPQSPNDAAADPDQDGLPNAEEFVQNTDPAVADTDRDGIPDGEEVEAGSNPEESACLQYANANIPVLDDINGHWAQRRIEILQGTTVLPEGMAIVEGYAQTDGKRLFLPERSISRFELLKLALFSNCIKLEGDASQPPMIFKDLPFLKRPHEPGDRLLRRQVIYTAASAGIVEGYEDGTFRPDAPITRAEALKIILKASRLPELFGIGDAIPLDHDFTDVDPAQWYAPYLAQALILELVEGYSDSTFRPGTQITRAEAAKIIHAALIGNPGVNSQVIPAE